MKRYDITGMSCAACAARIEKAVNSVEGVSSCAVNLLTNSMTVEGSAEAEAVMNAVKKAGYQAAPSDENAKNGTAAADGNKEISVLTKRLIAGIIFLVPLLYLTMGHEAFGFPLPVFLVNNAVLTGMIRFALCTAVLIVNKKFFISGTKSALHGSPNMDTLVAAGSGASYIRSTVSLVALLRAAVTGTAAESAGGFYFDSAAMILVFITVGKLLEAKSKGRTTDAINGLKSLAPAFAKVIKDGKEVTVPVEEIRPGDIFTVRPGESIPADGIITEGSAAVNEAALTGEGIPVDKTAGDPVWTATVDQSGFIKCKATSVGEDTVLSQIIRTVSDAAAEKAPAAKLADKVAGVFVPAIVGIAIVTLAAHLISGAAFDTALERAVAVLVVSCPCALGLATPVAVMAGSGVGAKHGILFKTAASLEQAGKIKVIALDKTGTVTKGEPAVSEIIPAPGVTEDELLKAACSAEIKSDHPLAGAVIREAEKRGIVPEETENFIEIPGKGVSAVYKGKTVYGGSVKFILSKTEDGAFLSEKAADVSSKGATPLVFAYDGAPLGVIAAADEIKEDSAEAVKELESMGIPAVMLTGDNRRTAEATAKRTGIKHVAAGLSPGDKTEIIGLLKKLGTTAMAGDGINDAPALTAADTGFAMGARTGIASDAADVVLTGTSLKSTAAAIRLSRAVYANIKENLFWAFLYNAVCIPLAAGCFSGLSGAVLSPAAGAAAMSLSSFIVVMNALRLNVKKINGSAHGRRVKKPVADSDIAAIIEEIYSKEQKTMTKTLKIEGMMCPHCEAHTKKALEAVDGVETAEASFRDGTATVTLSQDVDDTKLKEAVENAGYTVIDIN